LAALLEQLLADHFGEVGRRLWKLARGEDDRPVAPDREAKALSAETTIARDLGDRAALRVWLLGLVDHLGGRLRREGLFARAVELKVRSADFSTRTRSRTLPEATNGGDALWRAAACLLERCLTDELLPLRLLGVGAVRLASPARIKRPRRGLVCSCLRSPRQEGEHPRRPR
jgi:DNA polymerase-4